VTRPRPRPLVRTGLLAGLIVVALAGVAVAGVAGSPSPAAESSGLDGTHGNHLSTDAQIVADETVLVESLFVLGDGYLVIRADNGGDPGEPIGHVAIDSGFQRAVAVDTDRSFWTERDGPVQLHAALHGDDGDGEFEFGEDPVLRSPATGEATTTFAAEASEEPAHVAARDFSGQSADDPAVTIRRAALPSDGELVVHEATLERTLGDRVGSKALSAGTHEDVRVPLNETYFESLETGVRTQLYVTVHVDGDPLTVGGEPVRTLFKIRPSNGSGGDWSVNTPVPTTAGGETTGETTADPADATTAPGTATDPEGGGAPGFGVAAALAAVAGLVLRSVARRFRR
jgi:hypothetical protein